MEVTDLGNSEPIHLFREPRDEYLQLCHFQLSRTKKRGIRTDCQNTDSCYGTHATQKSPPRNISAIHKEAPTRIDRELPLD